MQYTRHLLGDSFSSAQWLFIVQCGGESSTLSWQEPLHVQVR